MQLTFCLEMLYTELPFLDRLGAARRDGVESFEIWDWRGKDLGALSESMRREGMKVSNMSGNREHGMIDPAERTGFLAELVETARIARDLDCPWLTLLVQPLGPDGSGAPVPPGLSERQRIDEIVACGKEAARVADDLGVRLALEALNDRVDHRGFLLCSSALAAEIVERVDHPRFRALYDIYHMSVMGEDVLADLRSKRRQVGYLHVADHPGRHEPGTGKIDYGAIFRFLREAGYDGFLGFEFSPSGESSRAVRGILDGLS